MEIYVGICEVTTGAPGRCLASDACVLPKGSTIKVPQLSLARFGSSLLGLITTTQGPIQVL